MLIGTMFLIGDTSAIEAAELIQQGLELQVSTETGYHAVTDQDRAYTVVFKDGNKLYKLDTNRNWILVEETLEQPKIDLDFLENSHLSGFKTTTHF